jgi:hypothetical protein
MAKGEQRSNREAKKPKKEKIKIIAAAPSQKLGGWQPTVGTGGTGKKKSKRRGPAAWRSKRNSARSGLDLIAIATDCKKA